jgi:hypothetical protein
MPKHPGRPKSGVQKAPITLSISTDSRFRLADLRHRLLKGGLSVTESLVVEAFLLRPDLEALKGAIQKLLRERQ